MRSSLDLQVAFINSVREFTSSVKERARGEEGEIGSQLLLMAMLVIVAAAAVAAFKGPLNDLVDKITGGLEEDVG